jgi:hypothetical protein
MANSRGSESIFTLEHKRMLFAATPEESSPVLDCNEKGFTLISPGDSANFRPHGESNLWLQSELAWRIRSQKSHRVRNGLTV